LLGSSPRPPLRTTHAASGCAWPSRATSRRAPGSSCWSAAAPSSSAGSPSSRWRLRARRSTATRAPSSSTPPKASALTSAGSTGSSTPSELAHQSLPTSPRSDREEYQMGRIRVAIAGVGNCASALVQGVRYYHDADPADVVPGLMHVELAGYHVRDLDFVCAFDVDDQKVGADLSKAIFSSQNNTIRFADVSHPGVTVQRGPTLDGLSKYYRDLVDESPAEPCDVAAVLRETRADVLVSYLPVGSENAQRFYAQAALDAKVAFVNAIPVFIASDPKWAQRFTDAGV